MKTSGEVANKPLTMAEPSRPQQQIVCVGVNNSAINHGNAIPALSSRARAVFRLGQKENSVLFDRDAARYGKNGTSSLTIGEWAESLEEEAPYLFENCGR